MRIVLLFLGVLLTCGQMQGQRKILQNRPKYDNDPLHFGFALGVNFIDFVEEPMANLPDIPGYYSVKSVTEPGYTIAIISNLRLHKYLDLRFNPAFSSTVRNLEFDILNPLTEQRDIITREVESSYIDVPLELKFKSQRINNYRLYILGGVQYNLDLASNEDVLDDRVFKIQSSDLFYSAGFGIDIYFEYFKFSPQIKGIWGLTDLIVEDGTFLVEGIQSLRTRGIVINFTFE